MKRFATASVLGLLLWACDGAGPTGFADIEANLSLTATGPSVTTDKPDYQPGDTVTITGSGFAAGETVRVHISEDPPNHPDWSFDIVADGTGGFVHRQLVMDQLHLGVLFVLTATGQTSGLVAGTMFTDGSITSASIQIRDAACSTADSNFSPGETACAFLSLSINGSGTTSYWVQWVSPTGVRTTNAKTHPSLGGGTHAVTASDTHSVSEVGDWTVVLCRVNPGTGACSPSPQVLSTETFTVTAPNTPPAAPTSLGQFRGDGITAIAIGGGTNQTIVVLRGVVSDPDVGNTVKLQVEVQPVGTPFTNVFTQESALVASGASAPVTVGSLTPGVSYHWQARTVDNTGATSAWGSFGGNAETDTDFYVDTAAPTVTINQAAGQADPTNASPINFTVVFSESVTGFTDADVTLSGSAGAMTAVVTGGPTSYNVAVSGMTGPGAVIASLEAGAAQDAVGNNSVASTSTDNSVAFDATPPTVTINQAAGQADPTGTSPINFTVVFSETVTGFIGADVSLGGTAGATTAVVTGGPAMYNVAVSGMTGTGTVIPTLVAGVAQDAAGNASLASTSTDNSVTYDQTPPEVSNLSVTPSPTNGTVDLTFTATAMDGITTVSSAQYRINLGGFLAMVAADGAFDESEEVVTVQIPSAAIAALADGNHTLCVRASDAFGNQSDADDSCTNLLVDKTPPALLSVAATPSPTNGTVPVVLNATATDALTNVTSAEYNIDGGTFAGMSASDGGFNELEEDVTVTIAAGVILALSEGSHTLCVRATDSVGNVSGNATACTTLFVDKTPPTVTAVSASPNPANGTVNVTLTATATDLLTNIALAQYRIDAGAFIGMSAADGTFDELVEGVTVSISSVTIAGLSDGNHTLCVRATDAAGNRSGDAAACTTLVVDKTPPVVSGVAAAPNPTNGTANVVLTATATDALTNVTSAAYTIDGSGGGPMAASDLAFDELSEGLTATIPAATINALSEGNHQLCVTATDAVGNTTDPAVCTTLMVDKSPPVVSAVAATPNPVAAGSNTSLTATISDATTGGSNVTAAQYRATNPGYDSGWLAFNPFTPGVTVNVTKSLNLPVGVYDVCVRGTDAAGNTTASDDEMCVFLAVYDPSAGFVTGGGWINSPLGASTLFPEAVGKATFGFVSKYRRGANQPEGQTQFQFRAADLNFHSEAYEWLVVAGARAQYKGTGAINGVTGYGFMLTAIDGQVNGGGGTDKFRIKIWHVGTGGVIYDNQMGMDDSGNPTTVLGGGSIVIHAR